MPSHLTEHVVAERILDWHEEAVAACRESRADALLLLAWSAFEGNSGRRMKQIPASNEADSGVEH
jgi:hypothetical protein